MELHSAGCMRGLPDGIFADCDEYRASVRNQASRTLVGFTADHRFGINGRYEQGLLSGLVLQVVEPILVGRDNTCKHLYRLVSIIQILTGTVMKYHVSVDCQELYFPKGLYFPRVHSTKGKYCPEGKYNYLGTTDTWYFIRPGRYLLYSQPCLLKSNSHKSNNRLSRRSFQVLFSLYSIVFNPS